MNIIDTRSLVSMDQFKDMLAIEKAFGPIQLGHQEAKIDTCVSTDENNSLWTVFANQVSPNTTNTEFHKFLEIIEQASIQS